MLSGGFPATDQSFTADSRFAEREETTERALLRSSDLHNRATSSTMLRTRSPVSIPPRTSAREGIHDDVDAKARIVDSREALVIGVVVPFRAVVLVAVENSDPVAMKHGFQVLVNEVVAPAIQLMTGRRWSFLELEERAVQWMRVREIDRGREAACDFFHRGLVKNSADVVVVVVHENHPATLHEPLRIPPLGLREPEGHVTGKVDERILEYSRR